MKTDEFQKGFRLSGTGQSRDEERNSACRAYLKRMSAGGRTGFARGLDYVTLRGVAWICAYLYFAPRFANPRVTILLSCIALAMFMLLLRVIREIMFERFVEHERTRIHNLLLLDKLLLLDLRDAAKLCAGRYPALEACAVLQRALPIDADTVLAVLRTHRSGRCVHIFATTEYDRNARALAARFSGRLALHGPEELCKAAVENGLTVSQEEMGAYMLEQQRNRRAETQRKRQQRNPFERIYSKKYVLIALLLIGASFFTRYTLYYRMLAGLCMTIAACGAALPRVRAHQS